MRLAANSGQAMFTDAAKSDEVGGTAQNVRMLGSAPAV